MADLIFTKYSNERSRRFAIRTDIMEEADKSRYVKKTALTPEGKQYVEQIGLWYEKLNEMYGERFFSFNKGTLEGESLYLEYVSGQTLETVLDELSVRGEVEKAAGMLREYLDKVKEMYQGEPFVMTDRFREVFGDLEPEGTFTCGRITDIDMVCSNLVLAEKPIILDYEWTFDFPIPCEFVLYRIIRYCQDPYSARKPLCDVDFYRDYGITEALTETFLQMELNFQDYLTAGHVPMREMYRDMTPGNAPLQIVPAEELQVFFDLGEGYTQENSRRYPIKEKKVSVKVSLPKGCRRIRLDPGDNPCAVSIAHLSVDGENLSLRDVVVEGGCRAGHWAYIPKTDPFLADIPVPENGRELTVRLLVYPVDQKVLEGMCRQFPENKLRKENRFLTRVKKHLRR